MKLLPKKNLAQSKSLVPVKPGGRSVKTVDGDFQLAGKGKGGELSTERRGADGYFYDVNGRRVAGPGTKAGTKKGGTNIVNAGSKSDETVQTGSGQILAMNTAGNRLIKVSDAASVAISFGAREDGLLGNLTTRSLSWGNKRKREALADGGSIQRRLGGTGFGGANNKGFTKGRGSRKRISTGTAGDADTRTAGGGTKGDPFDYVSKKRSSGALPTPDGGETPRVDSKGRPLALEDTKHGKVLAIEDSKGGKELAVVEDKPLAVRPKVATPLRDELKEQGEATKEMAVGEIIREGKRVYAEAKPIVRDAYRDAKIETAASREAMAKAHKLKWADIKKAFFDKEYLKAIDLATTSQAKWVSAEEQQKALDWLEAKMRKK